MGQYEMKLAQERDKNEGLRRNVGGGVMRVAVFTTLPPPDPPLSTSLSPLPVLNFISVDQSVHQVILKKSFHNPTLNSSSVQKMCEMKKEKKSE